MSNNTVLRIGSRRGKRMTEAEAMTILRDLGFEPSAATPVVRIEHRGRSAETLIRRWERTRPTGDPDAPWHAVTRSTYSI